MTDEQKVGDEDEVEVCANCGEALDDGDCLNTECEESPWYEEPEDVEAEEEVDFEDEADAEEDEKSDE